MKLINKKVLSFDCYGTLIDWESGLVKALRTLGDEVFKSKSHDELLGIFANIEHAMQADQSQLKYQEILYLVAQKVSEENGLTTSEHQLANFSKSILEWQPFEDTTEALQKLSKHFKLVILSNVDNESIAVSAHKMGDPFYKILTAEDVGAYKPSHKMFEYLFTTLENEGISRDEILHVAQSIYHDHVPAYDLWLDSVWINRRHDKVGQGATKEVSNEYTPKVKFRSLKEFVEYVDCVMKSSIR